MIKLAELQGLRTALHLNDESYFHGANIDDAILEAVDHLIDAKTEMEDPDKHLAHYVKASQRTIANQAEQIETLQQMNQQLRAFVAVLNKPKDIEHYKTVISENSQGKTPEQWADIIRLGVLPVEEKEELLLWLERKYKDAVIEHGETYDVTVD